MRKLSLALIGACAMFSQQVLAADESSSIEKLQSDIKRLQHQVARLSHSHSKRIANKPYENKTLTIHTLKDEPDAIGFHPAALMAGDYIFTYIAGMPVVTSPYLGARPAFDGSDLIVNISSINQDLRLMMQRRAIYRALDKLGYPAPNSPLIAISGSIEPMVMRGRSFTGRSSWDLDLGGSELDIATALNSWVEGFFSFAYDSEPPYDGGQRLANSAVRLNKSFINIGNIDKTPFYMTAGQFYVPFGRYSSSMISSPLTMRVGKTKARAVLVGFKRPTNEGFYASLFGFRSDTSNGDRGVGGANLVYDFDKPFCRGEFGASYITAINDAGGMQITGNDLPTFAGFGINNQTEAVDKVPGFDIHTNVNIDAFAFMIEWITATKNFRQQDLSFNSTGAKPSALNTEVAYTFKVGNKPASVGLGYGQSRQALALGMPKKRYDAVFNISLWRDTVQSLEYRHDIDYGTDDVGNGIGGDATGIRGTGRNSHTVSAQFGLYF